MLSLSKHLAEALLEKRHYLALAEQKLNNNNNPAAGKKKRTLRRILHCVKNDGNQAAAFVSTRFLGYARNDRGEGLPNPRGAKPEQ